MRSVTVRGDMLAVTDDPHRVLTQLLTCLVEQPSARELEARFARGAEGFAIPNVVEARPSTAPDWWTVTMHHAKAVPRVVEVGGDELRHLVHAALFPLGGARGERNRREATMTFGIGGAVFVVCTLGAHLAAGLDWFFAVPLGLMAGIITGARVARGFLQ